LAFPWCCPPGFVEGVLGGRVCMLPAIRGICAPRLTRHDVHPLGLGLWHMTGPRGSRQHGRATRPPARRRPAAPPAAAGPYKKRRTPRQSQLNSGGLLALPSTHAAQTTTHAQQSTRPPVDCASPSRGPTTRPECSCAHQQGPSGWPDGPYAAWLRPQRVRALCRGQRGLLRCACRAPRSYPYTAMAEVVWA
jgi:hypothetical protein